MSHIIQKFGDWKKVNEDDTPGRTRERGDNRNKVVAIPIDKTTLKLKIVNDADVIGAGDKLTIEGFDAILDWLKGQGKLLEYYPLLAALTLSTETRTLSAQEKAAMQSAIIIYDVSKDTDRKQVIMFRIADKTSLQGNNQTTKINPLVRFVKSSELTQALGGTLLNVKAGSNIVIDKGKATAGFKLPYPIASLADSTDTAVYRFVLALYNKILLDARAAASPLVPKVRAELGAKKLGKASQLFIKALNAGFAIQDNDFPTEIEADDITQLLVDKIGYTIPESRGFYLDLSATRIVEALSDTITGLDVDIFLAVAKTITPETGDIKVPEGGFTIGMKGNIELMKFQKLLYTKFKTEAGTTVAYQNFAKSAGDGKKGSPIGDYGKTTAALIQLIKEGLDKPVWQEENGSRGDGNTITVNFVKRIQDEIAQGKIRESREPLTYLGLDGNSIIINEDFGVPSTAAKVSTQPAAKPKAKSTPATGTVSTNTTGIFGPLGIDIAADKGWRYKVEGGKWRGRDKGVEWQLIRSPRFIAGLIAQFNQGYYLNVIYKKAEDDWSGLDSNLYSRKNNNWYLYNPADKTETLLGAGSAAATNLDKIYVTTKYVTGTAASATATPAQIDAELKAIANDIEKFVEGGTKFGTYKSWDDDEEGAWDDVLYPNWLAYWKPKIDSIRNRVNSSVVISAADKKRYTTTIASIVEMFTRDLGVSFDNITNNDSFRSKWLGKGATDTFTLKLLLSGSQSIAYEIYTDF
ncbi:hypothetical protein UFOVP972_66 [uncultured Caudovirales phage]|uniref:Uncharacterized protein n=1 Tax=uncultured Caudovirales phage TaxID=2100421 RepID=A0A6J5PU05_9CAUD|nr:hypothetical protein UFOVP972_66 [uncultured Caudovirales phage]